MEVEKFRKKPVLPIIIVIISLLISCGTEPQPQSGHDSAVVVPEKLLPPPLIIVSAYQETVYDGSPQPIYARCEPEIPLIITYFNSLDDYWAVRNGFYDAPAEPGVYSVNVNCAPGYGYEFAQDILVEYCILKAPVRIFADSAQSSVYNGSPRRVQAESEPEVPLSYSYYPNPGLLQAALDVFTDPGSEQYSLASALQRFTRVESAPVEQGVYYVLVYFNGNDRYEPAHAEVEFTINPAPAARRK